MNQPQPYMDVNQSHPPPPGSSSSMTQYSGYGQPQALQPASHSYAPAPYAYSYANTMPPMSAGHPVTSSMGGQMVQPLPTMATSAPPGSGAPQQNFERAFDSTGQIAPPGMKPRVTATLWEDEGSLCFQVEANGVCVARREDNHMINGTKLLNVAGMTRGRRDGILKSEKTRHVVKIGPMHLKGVWIPFDRALDFANKEKITEMLYPLFVHNIGALLYHPTNQARQSIGNAAMAARRPDQPDYMRTPQGTQPPALTHHHSLSNPGAPPPHSIAPHPSSGRPGLERAHTFSTSPASASGLTIGMGNVGSAYEYGAQNASGINQASSPPGTSQGMQYPTSQAYDNTRSMYAASPGYAQYPPPQQSAGRYPGMQASPGGVKNEMGPPMRAGNENEQVDHKNHDGYGTQPNGDVEHESEYTHTSASDRGRRPSYSYKPNHAPGTIHSDPSHMSPEMTHSPHQNGGSGRATPRTTGAYQGYSTPQRASQLPSSNLYNVMSNDTRAGAPIGAEQYSSQQPAYQAPQYPSMNGAPQSNKRMREDDDEDQYHGAMSAGGDSGLKRQRTDPGMGRPMSQPQSVKSGPLRR
ncbi:hypothetical protein LTR62_000874 [Meristemomyces frigidus]|uniref:HTH APSES-type domain-containing protein n=1 Tax=Meristemomyces frigidus TaxID=1508187 RepID=A0AAN7YIC6_9PEZI|nr:hypothetical protein LTR62_000874 [Meristemomyces frigidus]